MRMGKERKGNITRHGLQMTKWNDFTLTKFMPPFIAVHFPGVPSMLTMDTKISRTSFRMDKK